MDQEFEYFFQEMNKIALDKEREIAGAAGALGLMTSRRLVGGLAEEAMETGLRLEPSLKSSIRLALKKKGLDFVSGTGKAITKNKLLNKIKILPKGPSWMSDGWKLRLGGNLKKLQLGAAKGMVMSGAAANQVVKSPRMLGEGIAKLLGMKSDVARGRVGAALNAMVYGGGGIIAGKKIYDRIKKKKEISLR